MQPRRVRHSRVAPAARRAWGGVKRGAARLERRGESRQGVAVKAGERAARRARPEAGRPRIQVRRQPAFRRRRRRLRRQIGEPERIAPARARARAAARGRRAGRCARRERADRAGGRRPAAHRARARARIEARRASACCGGGGRLQRGARGGARPLSVGRGNEARLGC